MWKHTFTDPALVVWEREDRGGVVHARWWRTRPGQRGYWAKASVGMCVRDGATGEIDADLERSVLRRAGAMHRDLRAGVLDPSPEAALTVRAGLDRFLAVGSGACPARTRRHGELVRAARVIGEHLGPETRWRCLGTDAGPTVWRALALESRGGRGRTWAEAVVATLYQAADWLRARGLVEGAACPRPARWRRALGQDWRQIVGREPEPLRRRGMDRYTLAEVGALVATAPEVDPRLALALAIGLEGRLGAVAEGVRRSDLDLSASGRWGHGRVRIPGAGAKGAMIVDLDEGLRARMEHELADGYLRALEVGYQLGRMDDYPLMAGGRLRHGAVPASEAGEKVRPWSRASLARAWRRLEAAAGVRHDHGRGWRGVRRTLADVAVGVAEDLATDSSITDAPIMDGSVLDELGGWARGSRTRERVYRLREDARVRNAAADLRREVRRRVREAGPGSYYLGH